MTLNVRPVNQQKILSILGSPSDTSSSNSVIGILKRLHSSSTSNGETIEYFFKFMGYINKEIYIIFSFTIFP